MEFRIILTFITVILGIYGLGTSKNIIKSILCLQITESAVILLFLAFAQVDSGVPPIFPNDTSLMVDPLPQALMITTIIIGSSITALALMLSIKLYHHFGTLNWNEIMDKEG